MPSSYKITDQSGLYFITFTVVNWIDAFTRDVFGIFFMKVPAFAIKTKVYKFMHIAL